jgi:hypothetical protein
MEDQTLFVVYILSGVILGIALGVALATLWHNWRSRRFREQQDIPNIIGKWQCQWFDDAKESNEPKIVDTIEIQKWLEDGQFLARGFQPQFHLSYPLMGEIDPSRVVTLIYKAARYPYEPNRGIACLQLSRDGETMEGYWFGRRSTGQLGGGKVKWFRSVKAGALA